MHSFALRPEEWLRFVQIDPFPGQWRKLRLREEDLEALELLIMVKPTTGSVIPGTKGLRKLRFNRHDSDRGKSGSYRVFYVFFAEYGIITLHAIIGKNQTDDLTKAQCNAFAKLIDRLQGALDKGVIK